MIFNVWKKGCGDWELSKEWFACHWADIIGDFYCDNSCTPCRPPHTRIEALTNFRKCMFYISKYISKVPRKETCTDAASRSDAASCESSPGFTNVTNQAEEEKKYLHVGRWWGVEGGIYLPRGVLRRFSLPLKDVYKALVQAKHWIWTHHVREYVSFEWFTSDCEYWLQFACSQTQAELIPLPCH